MEMLRVLWVFGNRLMCNALADADDIAHLSEPPPLAPQPPPKPSSGGACGPVFFVHNILGGKLFCCPGTLDTYYASCESLGGLCVVPG